MTERMTTTNSLRCAFLQNSVFDLEQESRRGLIALAQFGLQTIQLNFGNFLPYYSASTAPLVAISVVAAQSHINAVQAKAEMLDRGRYISFRQLSAYHYSVQVCTQSIKDLTKCICKFDLIGSAVISVTFLTHSFVLKSPKMLGIVIILDIPKGSKHENDAQLNNILRFLQR